MTDYYDYAIVGKGLAGTQLALSMSEDPFFYQKRILIIESIAQLPEKTFCFWSEYINPELNSITNTSWEKTLISHQDEKVYIDLHPYTYHKINSADFCTYAESKMQTKQHIFFLYDEVIHTEESAQGVEIRTKNKLLKAKHVFDSRLPVSMSRLKKESIFVNQSFLGFFVEMEGNVFDTDCFTMMDFDCADNSTTSFMYMLPETTSKALFEVTFFCKDKFSTRDCEHFIKSYIKRHYPNKKYKIRAKEVGEIPMCSYNFRKHNSNRITYIGTAGGWVKASTGYSFRFAQKNVDKILQQIKNNEKPIGLVPKSKYTFYDKLLLKILFYENHLGATIFGSMFQNVKPELIFKFLDEDTSFYEDLKVIIRMPYIPFIKALFR